MPWIDPWKSDSIWYAFRRIESKIWELGRYARVSKET